MLVRDTDAHDGNYVRDLRRKIALFDLGCALGDRPLPPDATERMCLDNFEIFRRVPELLETAFGDRHIEYIRGIDFAALTATWSQFEYQEALRELARQAKSELVPPQRMVRVMEMHAKFLLACADCGRTVRFAAHVMYSGLYDDVWLEVGVDIDALERRLIGIAGDMDIEAPRLETRADSPTGGDDMMDLASTHGSIDFPSPKSH
jgi:hypothetical protein